MPEGVGAPDGGLVEPGYEPTELVPVNGADLKWGFAGTDQLAGSRFDQKENMGGMRPGLEWTSGGEFCTADCGEALLIPKASVGLRKASFSAIREGRVTGVCRSGPLKEGDWNTWLA